MSVAHFPICCLPAKVFERITLILSLEDLYEFAMSSETSAKMVSNTFLNDFTRARTFYDVKLTSEPIITLMRNNDYLLWKFYGRRSSKQVKYKEQETYNVNFKSFDSLTDQTLMFHTKRPNLIVGFYESVITVINFSKFLCELFGLSIRVLTVDPQYLDNLQAILSINQFCSAKDVNVNPGYVTHNEMRQLLQSFKPESLSLCCSPEPGFKFAGVIRAGCFHDREEQERLRPALRGYSAVHLAINTSWFNLAMLEAITCLHPRLMLATWTIQNEQINEILRSWLSGSDRRKLKTIFSKWRLTHREENVYYDFFWDKVENWEKATFQIEQIMSGLNEFICNDNANVPLLQRNSDGMLMQVEVENQSELTVCKLSPFFPVQNKK